MSARWRRESALSSSLARYARSLACSTAGVRALADGLILRTATEADIDGIVALTVDREDPEDGPQARLVLEDPEVGPGCWTVVVDGERVVSALVLLPDELRLGGLPLPVGQVDFVATDRRYEGRGLVRAQMDLVHHESAQQGQLVQVLIGIPYFYRQFGYEYAVAHPSTRVLTARSEAPADVSIRLPAREDLPTMRRLQDAAQDRADLTLLRNERTWRWLLDAPGVELWLAEEGGQTVGMARVLRQGGSIHVAEVAGPLAAVRALLAHAEGRAGDGRVTVADRPGTPVAAELAATGRSDGEVPDEYYIRVQDPVTLLDHLRPVLSERLSRSPFAEESGPVLVSFYRSSATLHLQGGEVVAVERGPAVQSPVSSGGAGVAPDHVAKLLFGRHGAVGLERRHPDVNLGRRRGLMATLFPPVTADLLTYYLP